MPAKLTHFSIAKIESDRGKIVTVLTCVATGVPPPEITWHKSGVKAEPDEIPTEVDGRYTSTLTLKSGDDVGQYSCTVKNEYSKLFRHSFAAPTHAPIASE